MPNFASDVRISYSDSVDSPIPDTLELLLVWLLPIKVNRKKIASFKHEKAITLGPVLSSHSKIDKTKVFKRFGSLMQLKSTARCSTFCNTFDLN